MRDGWKLALAAAAMLGMSLPARADKGTEKPPVKKPGGEGGKSVIQLDLAKLPPELAAKLKKLAAEQGTVKKPRGDKGIKKPLGDKGIKKPLGDKPFKKPLGNRPIKKPQGDKGIKKPEGDKHLKSEKEGLAGLGQAILMFEKGGKGKVLAAEVTKGGYQLVVVLADNTKATITLDRKGHPADKGGEGKKPAK